MVWFGPTLLRRLVARTVQWARGQPRLDPYASRVGSEQRQRLQHALAQAVRSPELSTLSDALHACSVDRFGWVWRDGAKRLQPLVARALEREPQSVDLRALRAQVLAHLGDLAGAKEMVDQLPPDHWRACFTRALLYDAAGDVTRTSNALVAALELAPQPPRPFLVEQLERFAAERR